MTGKSPTTTLLPKTQPTKDSDSTTIKPQVQLARRAREPEVFIASGPPGTVNPQRTSLPSLLDFAASSKNLTAVSPQATLPPIALPPIDKMAMSSVITPNPMPEQRAKISMTSKEWVIPPRPKPGRKPATDTPPTKRKAQNRAAQRAFRERRAARVGELEELLDDQKKTQETQTQELNDRIHSLEMEVQSFRSRCALLESMLERERSDRIRAEMRAENLGQQQGGTLPADDTTILFHKRYVSQSDSQRQQGPKEGQPSHASDRHMGQQQQQQASRQFSISHIISPPETISVQSPEDVTDPVLTCGNCSPTGRCACAEEVLASVVSECGKCAIGSTCHCFDVAPNELDASQELKRPMSPSAKASKSKRHHPLTQTTIGIEQGFDMPTHDQSLQPTSFLSQMSSADGMPFRDSCGFCKDGTYCVCAEAAMATPAMTPNEATSLLVARSAHTPPPLHSQTTTAVSASAAAAPMAMEMTADGAVKLPPRKPKAQKQSDLKQADSGRCGPNGPGTCAQCLADPKSGLFCRLMAANLYRKGEGSGSGDAGCCGGKGNNGGGCCKVRPAATRENITLPSLPSLGLSCAEAYQTLSSHRNFERAADEIGSWLPKLKATPSADARAAHPGRMPIEVEAASIMSVLKEFDIRFGREC